LRMLVTGSTGRVGSRTTSASAPETQVRPEKEQRREMASLSRLCSFSGLSLLPGIAKDRVVPAFACFTAHLDHYMLDLCIFFKRVA
jgi:hypothetical protein